MNATHVMSVRRRLVILLGAMIGVVAGSLSLLAAPASATFQSVNLSVDARYQLIGGTATLTAGTLSDVGPTPWYIETYDQTTGQRVCIAGTGTSCVAKVSYGYATTHSYISYIAGPSFTNPPPSIQYRSQPVTVTWQAPLVLNANRTSLPAGQYSTLTASSSYDVGSYPWWIQIYDKTTGQRLVACGSGTTCSASVTVGYRTTHTYVALIAYSSATLPPSGFEAVSNDMAVTWYVIG